MDVIIRPMLPHEETTVRTLSATLPDMDMDTHRPPGFHHSNNTLVAVVNDEVVGHTTWSRHTTLEGVAFTTWVETIVAPGHRGNGVGRQLMMARAALTPGLVFGATDDDNAAMVHLLTSMGFHACQRTPVGEGLKDTMMYSRKHSAEDLNVR